jgi:hypothetical protein
MYDSILSWLKALRWNQPSASPALVRTGPFTVSEALCFLAVDPTGSGGTDRTRTPGLEIPPGGCQTVLTVAERESVRLSGVRRLTWDDANKTWTSRNQAAAAAVLSDKQCLWKKKIGAPYTAPLQLLDNG